MSASTFVIVSGQVVSIGEAIIDGKDGKMPTKTVTIIIENADRVFRIQGGTAVEYAISDEDARLLRVGAQVSLLVSSHQIRVKVVAVEGMPHA